MVVENLYEKKLDNEKEGITWQNKLNQLLVDANSKQFPDQNYNQTVYQAKGNTELSNAKYSEFARYFERVIVFCEELSKREITLDDNQKKQLTIILNVCYKSASSFTDWATEQLNATYLTQQANSQKVAIMGLARALKIELVS